MFACCRGRQSHAFDPSDECGAAGEEIGSMAAANALLAGFARRREALPQPPGRVLSPGLTRGASGGHRAPAPAHAAARGVQRRPFARDDRRPAKKPAIPAFSACGTMVPLPRMGGNHKVSPRRRVRSRNLRRTDRLLLTATPLHLKGQKIADHMRPLELRCQNAAVSIGSQPVGCTASPLFSPIGPAWPLPGGLRV